MHRHLLPEIIRDVDVREISLGKIIIYKQKNKQAHTTVKPIYVARYAQNLK